MRFPVVLIANWLKEVMLPITMKIGSMQLRTSPIDKIQTMQPEMAPACADFIIHALLCSDIFHPANNNMGLKSTSTPDIIMHYQYFAKGVRMTKRFGLFQVIS
jgi:hypothetical protein